MGLKSAKGAVGAFGGGEPRHTLTSDYLLSASNSLGRAASDSTTPGTECHSHRSRCPGFVVLTTLKVP